MSETLDRRTFIKSAAGSTIVLASLPAFGAPSDRAHGCKFFNAGQAAIAKAITEQIVPHDDSPDSQQAGVLFYIDGVLSGKFARFYTQRYERGLRLVDEVSQKKFHLGFASLTSDKQVSILQQLESGKAAAEEGQHFFALILQHTMEGYYGDPEHGGNRDNASWKMIGFEG